MSVYKFNSEIEFENIYRKNYLIDYQKMISTIANNEERNNKLIDLIGSYTEQRIIILSDRVNQLEYLREKIPNSQLVLSTSLDKDLTYSIIFMTFYCFDIWIRCRFNMLNGYDTIIQVSPRKKFISPSNINNVVIVDKIKK